MIEELITEIRKITDESKLKKLAELVKKFNEISAVKKSNNIYYEYYQELPDGCEKIENVNGWEFEDLFYHPIENEFYKLVIKKNMFKKLFKLLDKGGQSIHVNVNDKNGKLRAISFSKFRRNTKKEDDSEMKKN
jgi:hypothetical protein